MEQFNNNSNVTMKKPTQDDMNYLDELEKKQNGVTDITPKENEGQETIGSLSQQEPTKKGNLRDAVYRPKEDGEVKPELIPNYKPGTATVQNVNGGGGGTSLGIDRQSGKTWRDNYTLTDEDEKFLQEIKDKGYKYVPNFGDEFLNGVGNISEGVNNIFPSTWFDKLVGDPIRNWMSIDKPEIEYNGKLLSKREYKALTEPDSAYGKQYRRQEQNYIKMVNKWLQKTGFNIDYINPITWGKADFYNNEKTIKDRIENVGTFFADMQMAGYYFDFTDKHFPKPEELGLTQEEYAYALSYGLNKIANKVSLGKLSTAFNKVLNAAFIISSVKGIIKGSYVDALNNNPEYIELKKKVESGKADALEMDTWNYLKNSEFPNIEKAKTSAGVEEYGYPKEQTVAPKETVKTPSEQLNYEAFTRQQNLKKPELKDYAKDPRNPTKAEKFKYEADLKKYNRQVKQNQDVMKATEPGYEDDVLADFTFSADTQIQELWKQKPKSKDFRTEKEFQNAYKEWKTKMEELEFTVQRRIDPEVKLKVKQYNNKITYGGGGEFTTMDNVTKLRDALARDLNGKGSLKPLDDYIASRAGETVIETDYPFSDKKLYESKFGPSLNDSVRTVMEYYEMIGKQPSQEVLDALGLTRWNNELTWGLPKQTTGEAIRGMNQENFGTGSPKVPEQNRQIIRDADGVTTEPSFDFTYKLNEEPQTSTTSSGATKTSNGTVKYHTPLSNSDETTKSDDSTTPYVSDKTDETTKGDDSTTSYVSGKTESSKRKPSHTSGKFYSEEVAEAVKKASGKTESSKRKPSHTSGKFYSFEEVAEAAKKAKEEADKGSAELAKLAPDRKKIYDNVLAQVYQFMDQNKGATFDDALKARGMVLTEEEKNIAREEYEKSKTKSSEDSNVTNTKYSWDNPSIDPNNPEELLNWYSYWANQGKTTEELNEQGAKLGFISDEVTNEEPNVIPSNTESSEEERRLLEEIYELQRQLDAMKNTKDASGTSAQAQTGDSSPESKAEVGDITNENKTGDQYQDNENQQQNTQTVTINEVQDPIAGNKAFSENVDNYKKEHKETANTKLPLLGGGDKKGDENKEDDTTITSTTGTPETGKFSKFTGEERKARTKAFNESILDLYESGYFGGKPNPETGSYDLFDSEGNKIPENWEALRYANRMMIDDNVDRMKRVASFIKTGSEGVPNSTYEKIKDAYLKAFGTDTQSEVEVNWDIYSTMTKAEQKAYIEEELAKFKNELDINKFEREICAKLNLPYNKVKGMSFSELVDFTISQKGAISISEIISLFIASGSKDVAELLDKINLFGGASNKTESDETEKDATDISTNKRNVDGLVNMLSSMKDGVYDDPESFNEDDIYDAYFGAKEDKTNNKKQLLSFISKQKIANKAIPQQMPMQG